MRSQGFDSRTNTLERDEDYTVADFAESPYGQELYSAIKAGYSFPGVEDASDLTTMQMAFLRHADVRRQIAFLEGIAEIFSE